MQLITTNINNSNLSTIDLGVRTKKLKLKSFTNSDNGITDDDKSLSSMVGDNKDSNKDTYYKCTKHYVFEDINVKEGREEDDEGDKNIKDIRIFKEYFKEEDNKSEED